MSVGTKAAQAEGSSMSPVSSDELEEDGGHSEGIFSLPSLTSAKPDDLAGSCGSWIRHTTAPTSGGNGTGSVTSGTTDLSGDLTEECNERQVWAALPGELKLQVLSDPEVTLAAIRHFFEDVMLTDVEEVSSPEGGLRSSLRVTLFQDHVPVRIEATLAQGTEAAENSLIVRHLSKSDVVTFHHLFFSLRSSLESQGIDLTSALGPMSSFDLLPWEDPTSDDFPNDIMLGPTGSGLAPCASTAAAM